MWMVTCGSRGEQGGDEGGLEGTCDRGTCEGVLGDVGMGGRNMVPGITSRGDCC